MLIISGIFFNAYGNQSMRNSVFGYLDFYDVILVTAADFSSGAFISKSDARAQHPRLKVVSVWPGGTIRKVRESLKKIFAFLSVRYDSRSRNIQEEPVFANASGRGLSLISFKLRSYLLAVSALFVLRSEKVDFVCAYEINGLHAASMVKKKYPHVLLFGKFQGTILGPLAKKANFEHSVASDYPLEAWAMPKVANLDAAIMTNDGTFGNEVLEQFGLRQDRILFLVNGIDQRVVAVSSNICSSKGRKHSLGEERFQTISVSRLVSWKRVPLVVDAVGVAIRSGIKIKHTIIGDGNESEVFAVKNAIKRNGIEDFVDFIGPATYEYTLRRIAESDLLISAYAETNICNPVFEALALKTPVLSIGSEEFVRTLGQGAEYCFLISGDSKENITRELSDALIRISREGVESRRLNWSSYKPLTWHDRTQLEVEFIEGRVCQVVSSLDS